MKYSLLAVTLSLIALFAYQDAVESLAAQTAKSALVFKGIENVPVGSPTRLIVDTLTRVEALVSQGLARVKTQNQVKEMVRAMFDYSTLSQDALSFIWARVDAKERMRFQIAFRALIEANYIAKAKSYVGDQHQIRFAAETIDKKTAKVSCFVAQKEVDIQINYLLKKVGNTWKVTDIVLDEASLVASYRSQFSQFLSSNQNSLEQLIAKIESMSQKIEKENQKKI